MTLARSSCSSVPTSSGETLNHQKSEKLLNKIGENISKAPRFSCSTLFADEPFLLYSDFCLEFKFPTFYLLFEFLNFVSIFLSIYQFVVGLFTVL